MTPIEHDLLGPYLTGDDAAYVELKGLFLNMEGVATSVRSTKATIWRWAALLANRGWNNPTTIPFMPWASWRHMPDEDFSSIITSLRYAVKPINNTVSPSDDTPDLWAHVVATIGSPPFPTANEVRRK